MIFIVNIPPTSYPLPLPLQNETTHKACTSIKQNVSRPVVVQNHSLVQNNGLKSKRLNNQKQGIILYTYPKYTTNLSVSTLSTQKEVWEGEKETETPFAKIALTLLEI